MLSKELKNLEALEELKGKAYDINITKLEKVADEVEDDTFEYLVDDMREQETHIIICNAPFIVKKSNLGKKLAMLNQRIPRIVYLLEKVASGVDTENNQLEAKNILGEVFGELE